MKLTSFLPLGTPQERTENFPPRSDRRRRILPATRRGQSSLISLTTFQMKLTSRFLTVTGSNSGFSGMR